MNSQKAPPPAPPPKPRVLVVFGRIRDTAVDRAGWFGPTVAEAAILAAEKFGLKWLPVTSFEQHTLAKTLPEGVLNAQGQFSLPPAGAEVIERLETFHAARPPVGGLPDPGGAKAGAADARGPDTPHAARQPAAATGPVAAVPATGGVKAPTSPPRPATAIAEGAMAKAPDATPATAASPAPPASPVTAIPVADAARPPVAPQPSPTALWENLAVGSIVLGACYDKKGEFEGWWEARIVRINGNECQLRWYGAPPSEPVTEHERKYLALIHPDYAKEL